MLPLMSTALLALVLSFNVTKADVRKLLDAGVSEQTIVDYIRRNAPAEPLSVEDLTELKSAGASDAILSAMLGASRTSDAVRPSPSSSDSYSSGTTTYVPDYNSSYYGTYPGYSYSYSYPYYSYYPYSYPYSYYPYSYYRPYYRYPYYGSPYYRYNYNNNYYNYGRTYPNSVSPYRNQHQQPVRPQQTMRPQQTQPMQPQQHSQPSQPRHGGGGVPRR